MPSRTLRLIARQLLSYPLGSQTKLFNPVALVKLDDRFGFANWYITEFDQETKIAKAYVSGIGFQAWVKVSLDELLAIKAFRYFKRVKLDRNFQAKNIRQLGIQPEMYSPRLTP